MERLVEPANMELLVEFSGIPLESESGDAGLEAVLLPSTEKQAYGALVNAGFVRPANAPPSNVDNLIGIEDDDRTDTADGVGKVQACKIEK